MNFRCPVCFYDRMPYAPEDYHICPCCGTEFGNDDVEHSFEELRYDWIIRGARWFFEQPPAGWSAAAQLAKVGPYGVHTEGSAILAPLNKASMRDRDIHEPELQYA
jgi:hypothetical protein